MVRRRGLVSSGSECVSPPVTVRADRGDCPRRPDSMLSQRMSQLCCSLDHAETLAGAAALGSRSQSYRRIVRPPAGTSSESAGGLGTS